MLSDEPIDEDLEALLYAQVYYGKEQEVEVPDLTQAEPVDENRIDRDQVDTTSNKAGFNKHFYKKARYFESTLAQQDKEKENRDSFAKESITEPVSEEILNSENPLTHSTIESNTVPEILEKSLQDQTTSTQKDQNPELATTSTQFIKISTSSPSVNPSLKDTTQIVTTAVLSTAGEQNQPQLLNNITINQYLFPSPFEQRLRSALDNIPLSKKCKSDLNKLKKGHLSEQDFFNNLRRRLKIQKKQQNQIRQAYLQKQQRIAQSEVICLSDSENSDIEVVEVTDPPIVGKNKPLTMKEKIEVLEDSDSDNEPVDDDEIIYVAPPPVPVISIDTESDSDDSEVSDKDSEYSANSAVIVQESTKDTTVQTLPNTQLDNDETADDFLQPKNTPDTFNFSLHGSDFQEGEFVRPANPNDSYETESSTSTSDFNRDSSRQFSNTVKTIVFSEEAFPHHDIFGESNLESFGDFITPKRGDNQKKPDTVTESIDKVSSSKTSKRVNSRTSSESSSESEYEGFSAHPNLPDLSPMVCAESTPKKSKTSNKNDSEQPKKKKGKLEEEVENNPRSSKKKPKEKSSDKNVGILEVEEQAVADESARKTKRKSSEAVDESEEIPRKKSKKKRSKSGVEENEEISQASNVSDRNVSSTSQNKSSKDDQEVTSSTPSKSVLEDESDSSKKKKKKKKKHSKNKDGLENNESVALVDQQEVLTMEEKGDDVEDSSKKKGKKKKAKESSLSKGPEEENIIASIIENEKRNLEENNQALANEQEIIVEDNGKKKNKKRKQKESSEGTLIAEASSTTSNESESSKRTETGEKCSSLLQPSGGQEIGAGESIILEQSNDSSSKKKNKRKKRSSTDKRNNLEECVANIESANAKNSDKSRDQSLEEGEIVEEAAGGEKPGESIIEKPKTQEEEDIILIEQVIPNYIIESSDSDEDIITFDDVGDDLELANISGASAQENIVIDNKNFDVDYVKSKMSDNPEKWKILPTDRYNLNIAKKGPRCNKCRQFGHIAINCSNKSPLPVCTLCGETGHEEPRCPNKVCFTCGKPGNFSTVYCYMCVKHRKDKCNLCSIIGHRAEHCPDLWRRYFLTTTTGPLTLPKANCPVLKPRSKQWCSGCASNGHLEFECNTYNWIREYPASSPHIFKYSDVYEKAAPRPLQDKNRSYYKKWVAKTLQMPLGNVLDDGTKNSTQANVPATEGNPQITEKPAESLDSRQENRVVTQQIVGNQDSYPATQAGPSDAVDQSAQPTTQLPTNQIYQITNSAQQSTPKKPYSARAGRRRRKRKISPGKAKINPVSVLRPTGYTPYQTVLNPYSVLGAPSEQQQQGLFNQVPNDILARQLVDLASAVSHYQNPGNQYHHGYPNESNIYAYPQLDVQIPSAFNPMFATPSDAYQDFSGPLPQPYYDIQNPTHPYGDRDFLDRPHTITRDPMEFLPEERLFPPGEIPLAEPQLFIEDREGQMGLEQRLEDDFRRREENERNLYMMDLREWLNHHDPKPDFVPLQVPQEAQEYNHNLRHEPADTQAHNPDSLVPVNPPGVESVPEFNKTSKGIHVDESVMTKFNQAPTKRLKEFVQKELNKLTGIRQTDAKVFKKKLNIIDNLKKIEVKTNGTRKQMYFLYKQVNMFLFGVHRMFEGDRNLGLLRNFVYKQHGCVDGKRKGLLDAYKYIFGGEHHDFNYRRCLNTLTVTNKK